jgi:hypothetical protein
LSFHDHAAAFSGGGVVAFAFDQPVRRCFQIERGHEQFFQAGETGEAGEGIEDDRDFLGDFRIGREQTEVGVDARGPCMVVAGAEVDVLPEPVRIAADNEERLCSASSGRRRHR